MGIILVIHGIPVLMCRNDEYDWGWCQMVIDRASMLGGEHSVV